MFEKIKSLLSKKAETVPQDAEENWQPKFYEPEVDPYSAGHAGDYRG